MNAHSQITPATLKSWLDQNEAVLIDVREPGEYKSEHIAGARNIPLGTLSADNMPEAQDRKIVFQCASGNRSCRALDKIAGTREASDLYNLEGGITGWKNQGYATETSGKGAVLPLDRQVQIVLGLLVLCFTLLGYFMHPGFLFIPAFIGAGLLNAGITGWCGMALLVAKMPWNR